MFFIYYFSFASAILGYGFLLSKYLKINVQNLGVTGIIGIFFLTLISYISSIFVAHGYIFNLFILIIGLIFFFYFVFNFKLSKYDILLFIIIYTVLFIFVLLGKNHDDFPYYHFPYTYLLTQHSHPVGLGLLNNGFRNPSSLFFFNSLLFFPKIDIYLIHLGSVYFLGFSNLFFLQNIFNKFLFKEFRFYSFLNLFCFIFVNVLFVRLAEYGTDRGGQILILIGISILFLLINNNSKLSALFVENYIKFFLIIGSLILSLKPFYLIYMPLMFSFLIFQNLRKKFIVIIKSLTFILVLIYCFFSFFNTFVNSGCIIFPLNISCFENFSWSIPKNEIKDVKLWYELWSKAGATPNLIVEDRLNYIKNLHWVPNWIENYFFNKVSDYILSLLLIALIVFFTFKKKIWIKKNRTFFFIYLFIIFCLLEWFFNHPSLRYGGYHLFALLLFIPLSFKLEEFEINWQSFYKKSLILIFITITIFITRNIIRLNKELKLYDYNISNNLNYLFIGGDKEFYFRYDKYFREKNFRYYNYKLLGKKFLIIKN
jgi:hypothetical protein